MINIILSLLLTEILECFTNEFGREVYVYVGRQTGRVDPVLILVPREVSEGVCPEHVAWDLLFDELDQVDFINVITATYICGKRPG